MVRTRVAVQDRSQTGQQPATVACGQRSCTAPGSRVRAWVSGPVRSPSPAGAEQTGTLSLCLVIQLLRKPCHEDPLWENCSHASAR